MPIQAGTKGSLAVQILDSGASMIVLIFKSSQTFSSIRTPRRSWMKMFGFPPESELISATAQSNQPFPLHSDSTVGLTSLLLMQTLQTKRARATSHLEK